MENIGLVLKKLANIQRLVNKASEAGNGIYQDYYISNAQQNLLDLKVLLQRDEIGQAIDEALYEIKQNDKRFKNNEDAQILIIDPSYEFRSFEMGLYPWLKMRRKDLKSLHKAVGVYLHKHIDDKSQTYSSNFPTNCDELLSIVNHELNIWEKQLHMAQSKSNSRRKKKKIKLNAKYRLWLGLFGTGISLGNVGLAIPSIGLASAIATVSIKTGTIALAAAVFNTPKLINKIGK